MKQTLPSSYFYGDFEKNKLSFIASDDNGLLLRLVDDFLYISLSKHLVTCFVQAMYKGHPSYGCIINKDKSLVNFHLEINGIAVPKLSGSSEFPWCGFLLHTKTLDVKADYIKSCGTYVNDSISIETSRHPGESLVHKLMQHLKLKSHAIFMNTSLNSTFTVLRNIYQNFLFCAMKFHHHARGLPNHGEASQMFLKNTVFDILLFAPALFKSRAVSPTSSALQFEYKLNELQIIWLGAHAFLTILSKKQTNYPVVLRTLEKTLRDEQFNIFRKKLAAVVDPRLSKEFDHIFF